MGFGGIGSDCSGPGYYGGTLVQSATAGDFIEFEYTGQDCRLVFVPDVSGAVLAVTLDGVLNGIIDTKEGGEDIVAGKLASKVAFSPAVDVSAWSRHIIRLTNIENKAASLNGVVVFDQGRAAPIEPTLFNSAGRLSAFATSITRYCSATGSPAECRSWRLASTTTCRTSRSRISAPSWSFTSTR